MDMSNGSAQIGKGRIGLLATLVGCCLFAFALFGASNAKAGLAGGPAGGPIAVDFNYVGLDVTTALGGARELVLTPAAALGELELRGNYNSGTSGAFTVPKTGGLNFPDVSLDIGVDLEAQLGLTEDATGTYDPATGAMTFNPSISLTIGVSDVAALPIPGLGTGPLRCELAPLAVAFSTTNGWPSPGNSFDPGPGSLKNGAVAGAWDVKPDIVAKQGLQATCDLIGSLLEPVGGLWLAQSDAVIGSLPANTSPKPSPAVCGDGFTGTPPNCVAVPKKAAKVAIQPKPKGVTIKRGKSGSVKVTVRNQGEADATSVKVCGTISSKVAKKPKCVNLGTIAGGKAKTASIKLAISKKAKGKTSLKIKVTSTGGGSASSSATVTVKK
jgi:hypothetical protein